MATAAKKTSDAKGTKETASPARLIDAKIKKLGDWRGVGPGPQGHQRG